MTARSGGEAPQGAPSVQVRGYVLERREFNEMRMRLPRAVRRGVEPAPEGHVGLIAQALTGDEAGTPLSVLYGSVPASLAADGLSKLEQQLARQLA